MSVRRKQQINITLPCFNIKVHCCGFRCVLTIGVIVQAVNAEERVGLFDLPGSDLSHGLDRVQPTVLSQCHWDHLQSISK